ncbi:MAG: transposase [Nitrospirales bacterium]|nr:transposase [Nitrospirales bacterium]
MKPRRKCSQVFKQEAVQLPKQAGGAITQVAKDLGLNAAMVGRWCREANQRKRKAFPGTGTPQGQKSARLKRELTLVTRERDCLKKRQRSSPRPHGKGCYASTLSHHVAPAVDVSVASSLLEWLLREAVPFREPLGARLSTSDGGYSHSSCRE